MAFTPLHPATRVSGNQVPPSTFGRWSLTGRPGSPPGAPPDPSLPGAHPLSQSPDLFCMLLTKQFMYLVPAHPTQAIQASSLGSAACPHVLKESHDTSSGIQQHPVVLCGAAPCLPQKALRSSWACPAPTMGPQGHRIPVEVVPGHAHRPTRIPGHLHPQDTETPGEWKCELEKSNNLPVQSQTL